MLNIPKTNLYINVNKNDKRPDIDKQRDVLLATKQINLKTGEIIVVFSRTTPEKFAQNKSLKPLMLAAREEVDNLMKQSYFNKHKKNIPEDIIKNIKESLFHGDEKKYIHSSKEIKSSATQAQSKTPSGDTHKTNLANGDKTKLPIKNYSGPKAYSADVFEEITKINISNENDQRSIIDKQKDILLASKQINLKTRETIVVFTRTTPEKIAQNKSLKPLMVTAREEADNLIKQSYFNNHEKNIPEDIMKNIKENLFHGDKKKYIHSSKEIESSATKAQRKTQSHDTHKTNIVNGDKTKLLIKNYSGPKAYSADVFEEITKINISNENDKRSIIDKQKDILLASKQINLKTRETTVVFSRTTPDKIAQNKSLKPLMLAAREEVDNLLKQSYVKEKGIEMPEETLKSLQNKLSRADKAKISPPKNSYSADMFENIIISKIK